MTEPVRDGTVVYFILSHCNVGQVLRLIAAIRRQSPRSLVLIHHDAIAEPFDRAAIAGDDRVRVLERSIHGEWAHFSLVDIVLYGLADLEERAVSYDWLVLLSGQDFPVRPLADFERALAASGDGLLAYDPAPGQLLDRYRFRWMRFPRALEHGIVHRAIGMLTRLNGRQPYVRFLSGRVGCRIAVRPRTLPFPPQTELRKGTQWWAISRRAVAYVRDFIAAHPRFVHHYRNHTLMPDESFFQTILSSAHDLHFVNDDARYTQWATGSPASPEILRSRDYDAIVASGAYFARKFDSRIDEAIVERFDRIDTRAN
jgi:hypothetical protein